MTHVHNTLRTMKMMTERYRGIHVRRVLPFRFLTPFFALCFRLLRISLFLMLIFSLGQRPYADNYDVLRVNASVSPLRLSRGQEGKIRLRFTLKEGITISPQPSFIIEIDYSEGLVFPKDFFTASDLEIEIVEQNGNECLDLSQPVEIPFSVSVKAERGNHKLNGHVKFFACNQEEEWCLKDKTPFSAHYYTSNRIIRE